MPDQTETPCPYENLPWQRRLSYEEYNPITGQWTHCHDYQHYNPHTGQWYQYGPIAGK
jgi:hypothetical protein